MTDGPARDLSISGDGRHIVYHVSSEGTTQLYLRSLDDQEAQAIPGTEGAWNGLGCLHESRAGQG